MDQIWVPSGLLLGSVSQPSQLRLHTCSDGDPIQFNFSIQIYGLRVAHNISFRK